MTSSISSGQDVGSEHSPKTRLNRESLLAATKPPVMHYLLSMCNKLSSHLYCTVAVHPAASNVSVPGGNLLVDDLQIFNRVYTILNMGDFGVFKPSADMENAIHGLNVRQEGIP